MKLINNRYKIIKKLGEGGMGAVYLADDPLLGQVALKTINKATIDPGLIKIFKNEFLVMTRLRHPNLIRVYDFGKDENAGTYYLTMEYLLGQDMGDWRKSHSETSSQIIGISDQQFCSFDKRFVFCVIPDKK